jgi:hypothetical protein
MRQTLCADCACQLDIQVLMDSKLLHCSLPNKSGFLRRAWMPQFSAAPITYRANGQPVSLAVPLLA